MTTSTYPIGSSEAPSHTREVYSTPKEFAELVTKTARCLRAIQAVNPFTMLAGSGNSAAPLLGALGVVLDMPFILVRKKTDTMHHDYHQANGYVIPGDYIIIDDLVSSGATVNHIHESMKRSAPKANCAGILMYYTTGCGACPHRFLDGSECERYTVYQVLLEGAQAPRKRPAHRVDSGVSIDYMFKMLTQDAKKPETVEPQVGDPAPKPQLQGKKDNASFIRNLTARAQKAERIRARRQLSP